MHSVRLIALTLLAAAIAFVTFHDPQLVDPFPGTGFVIAGLVAAFALSIARHASPDVVQVLRVLSVGAFVVLAVGAFLSVARPLARDSYAGFSVLLGLAFATPPFAAAAAVFALTRGLGAPKSARRG